MEIEKNVPAPVGTERGMRPHIPLSAMVPGDSVFVVEADASQSYWIRGRVQRFNENRIASKLPPWVFAIRKAKRGSEIGYRVWRTA